MAASNPDQLYVISSIGLYQNVSKKITCFVDVNKIGLANDFDIWAFLNLEYNIVRNYLLT